MTVFGNGKDLCQEARGYYYELLCRDGAVPETIARHVEGCAFCQEEIRRLGNALHEADAPSKPSAGPVISALNRQFEFLGEQVRCSHVKPFLPDLVASSPRIRIPTPITVHVEKCPQCAKDLAAIGELDLPAGQLKRLGEFYSMAAIDDPAQDEPEPSTAALAAFSFDGSRPEDLDRVSRSPQRRRWIYEQRALATISLDAEPNRAGVLQCSEVSTADLFDFVLPFGLDAAVIRGATGRRDAVGTHIRRCRACLERVQSLHRTIYEIADRADSAVRTVCQCRKDADGVSEAGVDCAHRYPLDVWVLQDQRTAQAGVAESSRECDRSTRRSRIRSMTRSPLLQGSASLAAVVALVAILSFMMKTDAAKGTNFGDLDKKVQSARNVHLKSFLAGDPEPTYEKWRSGDLNKFAIVSARTCQVIDLNQGTKVIVDSNGLPGAPIELSPSQLDNCRISMNEDNPFADAPPEDELIEVPSDSSDPLSPRRLTYEITRDASKWKVFVDPVRRLPTRAEFFRWNSAGLSWDHTGTIELTYPTKAEMESTFKELARSK
jgi:hypothetical protein